ncbi:MAG: PAS domain S-box-containing protein [Desulforhopalus sp.]|jgi:PAS domain S-box-containing protein
MLTKSLRSNLSFFVLILVLLPLLASCNPFSPKIYTDDELQWLKSKKGSIEVLFGYEAPPNAFHDSDGSYKGLLIDFLVEIEKEIGITFVFHNFSQWNDLIEYSKTNNGFVIIGIAATEDRKNYLSFTDPFIKVPYVIVSKRSSTIETTTDLIGKKICTVANYAINDFLAEKFPTLKISPVADNTEGLQGVSAGIFDAMVLNQMYASFIIEDQGITNLKIAGESGYLNRLSAAASTQDPILSGILEKAVDQLSPRTRRLLYQKWLGQSHDTVSRTLLTSLLGIILCITTLLAIFWGWNISLKKTVKKRTRDIIQSRENYKTTLKSIGDGIITTDNYGIITGLNPIAEELTGCREEQALDKPLSSVFNIFDTDTREPLENPAEQVLGSGATINHPHHPTLISTSGQEYIIDDSAAPIKDDQGHIFGVILVFRNITNRYRVQQQLYKNEQQLSQYIAKAPIGVAVLNLRCEFVRVNKKMCEFSGFQEDELLQKELKDLLPTTYHADLRQALSRAKEYGNSNISPEFIHKSGARLFSSIHIGYITDDTYLIFFNDINQQKLAEEELLKMNKLSSIGTLAGGIAHDFNNILMGLFGNIEIAKDQIDHQHKAYEFLDRAGSSLGRATRLTQQLLTFSKGGDPVKEYTQILYVIREAINFDLAGSNILPVVNPEPNLWLTNVDQGQISQVFSNLLINAMHAMPEGGHLTVDLINYEIDKSTTLPLEPGDYVKVTVTDTGTGIEQEHLSKIFDPYFTTKQAGSGLGLASTYSIMVKHNGHIQVQSVRGEGTTFTLYLPAIRIPQKEKKQDKGSHSSHLENCRILAMDDDKEILNLMTRMLRGTKAQITTTVCGEDAIKEYQETFIAGQPFNVVVLDLTVPGAMGGQVTAAHIKKIDPAAQLIVSSGYAEDPILANHRDYGFTDVLSKPYTKIAFLNVLGRVMAKQTEPQSANIEL